MLKGPLQAPDLGGAGGRVSFSLSIRGPGPPSLHWLPKTLLSLCFSCVLSTEVLSHIYVSFCFVLHAENRL